MADARGWPDNDKIRVAYDEEGKRIGYASITEGRNYLRCDELAVGDLQQLEEMLKALDAETDKEFIVLRFVNPNYKSKLTYFGFNYYSDRWNRVMVKDFEGNIEETFRLFGHNSSFHNGVYESY